MSDASEYGSDFTPDEEDILNGLLQVQPLPETDNPIVNSELHLRDAEASREGLLCLRLPAAVTDQRFRPQFLNPLQAPANGKFFPDVMHGH